MSKVPLCKGPVTAVCNPPRARDGYRGTSLIRNSAPLGPYSRTIPRAPVVVGGGTHHLALPHSG